MTPSRDLISYLAQRHSTKSTDCTYLSPWRLTFLIHQTPFIYCWKLAFLYCIVKKPTSRYPICWKAYKPLSYLLGGALSVILLQFWFLVTNIPFVGTWPFLSWFVGIWITPQSFAIDKDLQNRTSLRWRLRWQDVTLLWSVSARS